jgi:hypothetical protein
VRRGALSDDETSAKSSKPESKTAPKRILFSSKHAGNAHSCQDSNGGLFNTSFDHSTTPPPTKVTKSSSQIPEGSQIVDLTQASSDPIAEDSSEVEYGGSSHELPGGSGWVKKKSKSQSSQENRNGKKKDRKIRKSLI